MLIDSQSASLYITFEGTGYRMYGDLLISLSRFIVQCFHKFKRFRTLIRAPKTPTQTELEGSQEI
jgi:hypothetical protein